MPLTIEQSNGINVIILSGKITTQTAQDLKKEFDDYCSSLNSSTLIEMKDVTYISSYFIGVLVDNLKKHRKNNFELYLSSVDPQILFVLKIAGLADTFKVYNSKEEALRELKPA